jgi:hypothetical protein
LTNGRIDPKALVPIPFKPTETGEPTAVAALVLLNESFKKTFHHDLYIRGGYRDYGIQVEYAKDPKTYAAKPGTSNHGWGLAFDVFELGVQRDDYSLDEYRWMWNNAPNFGFVNPDELRRPYASGIKVENWHWEFVGAGGVDMWNKPRPW